MEPVLMIGSLVALVAGITTMIIAQRHRTDSALLYRATLMSPKAWLSSRARFTPLGRKLNRIDATLTVLGALLQLACCHLA